MHILKFADVIGEGTVLRSEGLLDLDTGESYDQVELIDEVPSISTMRQWHGVAFYDLVDRRMVVVSLMLDTGAISIRRATKDGRA